MDRGDTAAIFGAGLGFSTGFWFHGPYPDDLDPGPYVIMLPKRDRFFILHLGV